MPPVQQQLAGRIAHRDRGNALAQGCVRGGDRAWIRLQPGQALTQSCGAMLHNARFGVGGPASQRLQIVSDLYGLGLALCESPGQRLGWRALDRIGQRLDVLTQSGQRCVGVPDLLGKIVIRNGRIAKLAAFSINTRSSSGKRTA